MSIKLSQIEGLMLGKKAIYPYPNIYGSEEDFGFNAAIEQIGEREIELLKEEVRNILMKEIIRASGDGIAKPSQYVDNCIEALSANLGTLLRVKK